MSDEKKSGLGLFINKKGTTGGAAAPGAAAAAVVSAKPKDVKKRWLYVGVAAIGAVVLGSSLLAPQKAPPVVEKKKGVADQTISVEPPKADQKVFETKYAEDLAQMKAQLAQVASNAAQKDREIAQLRLEKEQAAKAGANPMASPQLPAGIVPPPQMGGNGNTGGLGAVGSAPPGPPVPPSAPTFKVPPATPPAPSGKAPELPMMSPAPSGDPMVFDAPGKSSSAADVIPGAAGGGANVASRVTYKKNANAGLLPAGSFAPVVLLNGVDAGTSAATQSNPMPVLMNVLDQATLPGAAKYRIKNCFVLGTGYGDLSAERVYVRFSRLSCVDKTDRLVLSQEVGGYVVDSDGKLGLRGKVMDRQGAKLGKAMLAGFAQGLAGALGQAQGTVTSNLTSGTTSNSISGSAALRASGLSGAQVAASQLAEFYLKEAQSVFPVISIDTGRTATIVFTGTTALNWSNGDTQFVPEVKPNN